MTNDLTIIHFIVINVGMEAPEMFKALQALDKKLSKPVSLLIGGGAAMLLAHKIPLSTSDIDGLPLSSSITPAELDPLVKAVGRELGISPHWYNDYFNTFTYTLPKDFRDRLLQIFKGKYLTALALGKEDLLIMKCFAGREKDILHAGALLRKGADAHMVEEHLESLSEKNLPGANEALDFLEEARDRVEEQ